MLDWMLNTRRRFGAERTAQDRSRAAANGDWLARTDIGQVRASGLADGTRRTYAELERSALGVACARMACARDRSRGVHAGCSIKK